MAFLFPHGYRHFITFVEGLGVGCGKSYFVTNCIVDHLAKGGTVCYIRFQPVIEGIRKVLAEDHGLVLDESQLIGIADEDAQKIFELTPQGSSDIPVLVIADEIHKVFNAHDILAKENKDQKRVFFEALTTTRHDDKDWIFISQDNKNVDSRICRIATYRWFLRDMGAWKIPGIGQFSAFVSLLTLGIMSGNYFRASCYDGAGRVLFERKKILKRASMFAAYISQSERGKHKSAGQVQKKKLNKVVPPVTRKSVYMVRFFIVVLLLSLAYSGYKIYTNPKRPFSEFTGKTAPVVAGQAAAAGGSLNPVNAFASNNPERDKPKWDIYHEVFRGRMGAAILRTDVSTYQVGSMGAHGFVKGIQGDVVACYQPDGRMGYVVAQALPPLGSGSSGFVVASGSGARAVPLSTWRDDIGQLPGEGDTGVFEKIKRAKDQPKTVGQFPVLNGKL